MPLGFHCRDGAWSLDLWPALCFGDGIATSLAGANIPATGALDALHAANHRTVGLAWGAASPSAHVTRHAYEHIVGEMLQRLAQAGPLDGLYLDLHGAMMAAHRRTARASSCAALRARSALTCRSPSASIFTPTSRAPMVDHADVLTAYRTYPHVDMKETGARAMQLLLARIPHGRPWARVFAPLDFLIPVNAQLHADAADAADLSPCCRT